MGFKTVYQSLIEIFPQIDSRMLRAVAIEHSKDADAAVEVVLSEIVPSLPVNLPNNDTQPLDKVSKTISDEDAENEAEGGQLRHRRDRAVSRSNPGTSSRGTKAPSVEFGNSSKAFNDELVSLGKAPEKDTDAYEYNNFTARCSDTETGKPPVQLGESEDSNTKALSGEISPSAPTAFEQRNTDLTLKGGEDLYSPLFDQAESSSSVAVLEVDNAAAPLVDTNAQERALDAEQLSVSLMTDCETSKGSVSCEKGDAEGEGVFNTIVTRSGQVCSIDLLEDIIADAKSNKKTLFTVMESVMNLMREVEVQEKAAEQAKEEAARGGLDILNKVEELKRMLAHAKEANDMHAGEVYGEKSILATELRELQNRLLNLSEERDNSLAILNEMRETLEARLVAAEEMKKAADQEKLEKEESAKKALAEQEAIMEKVVQESKILRQEAEENSKLREFLMDRGRIVDSLQGEISVICQDVRLLKERFDERVPLSKSITSSQTSCRLASSTSSSLKSSAVEIATEPPCEIPQVSDNKIPTPSVNGNSPTSKLRALGIELLDDGWDLFDNEAERMGINE